MSDEPVSYQSYLAILGLFERMELPDEPRRREIENHADKLAERTILTEKQALWWAYRSEGYRREQISKIIGRTTNTVDTHRVRTINRLERLWDTIELLNLEEGQTAPSVED